jgi:hypothetical protein
MASLTVTVTAELWWSKVAGTQELGPKSLI